MEWILWNGLILSFYPFYCLAFINFHQNVHLLIMSKIIHSETKSSNINWRWFKSQAKLLVTKHLSFLWNNDTLMLIAAVMPFSYIKSIPQISNILTINSKIPFRSITVLLTGQQFIVLMLSTNLLTDGLIFNGYR